MVAAKTMMAMTPKPMDKLSVEERLSIEQFHEYRQLRDKFEQGLTPDEKIRYEILNEKNKHGELRSFVSYTDPLFFYFIYAIIVSIYTCLLYTSPSPRD